MAPNGHTVSRHHNARQSRVNSSQSWLEIYGHSEYEKWLDENPTQRLPFEDWKTSSHVNGLSLYYATLSIFEESDSSDDEAETIEVKPRPRMVRGQSAREPKKKVTINGNGLSRAASSATSSALANSEDLSPASKRKRKARKKYLSEEIIASDGDSVEEIEDVETSTPITETATPTAPIITVNGRRKSSSRKSRKKPLSEEVISPEDELDDPMAIDKIATPAIASPLPVRSAPKSPATGKGSGPPKKTHILKLNTRKAPKKKILSEETILDEDADASVPPPISTPTIIAVAEPNIDANAVARTGIGGDIDHDTDSTPASPDPGSASAAATRRGLRTRRPAQQRPYYHDAQLFEDVEPGTVEANNTNELSPDPGSRRASIVSLGKGYDDELLKQLDEETIALLQDDPDSEPTERRPKHFKGKGRAWKKEESDEDEEFTVAKRKAAKAAKAKAKANSQAAVQKKRGRPRKSVLSEDIVRDESESDGTSVSPARAAPKETIKKARKPPRKSALSEEIVPDSDSEAEKVENQIDADAPIVQATTPLAKKRGRPRKSDQSSASKSSTRQNENEEVFSPFKSTTPKDSPNKSFTPKGMPKTRASISSLQEANLQGDKSANGDSELGSDDELVAVSPLEKKSVSDEAQEKLCK